MRLAISNIAWDIAEDAEVASLLNRYAIDAIDIAPGKYFAVPAKATDVDIKAVKNWWAERGIEITGMQALLFGTTGFNVFGTANAQQAMLQHLSHVCRIGAGLGAKRIVFGSPKNRDRSGLNDAQAIEIAVAFFRQLGDIAQSYGVMICLEPNPSHYGANFMINSAETASITRQIAHQAICMQLDTGALTMNNELPKTVLRDSVELIGHVHASEPDLVPLGDGATNHLQMCAAIKQHLPQHLVCIEMVATQHEPHLVSIERAIKVAISAYRQDSTK